MPKILLTGDAARDRILEGATVLYDAVRVTLGPKGQNAIIKNYGNPTVTHDGVTVAKAVEIKETWANAGINVGVDLIRESSSKTNDTVGDGTTTSTILAYKILEQGIPVIKAGKNPMVLRHELEASSKEALAIIDTLSTPITPDNVTQVATISGEDEEIGRVVGEVFTKLGKDARVTSEIHALNETTYEITDGYKIDNGYVSPYMVNSPKSLEAIYTDVPVLVASGEVRASSLVQLIAELYENGKDSLVIVSPSVDPELVAYAAAPSAPVKVLAIKAPGFGDNQTEQLKDLAALTQASLVGVEGKPLSNVTVKDLGTINKIIAGQSETLIVNEHAPTDYITGLKAIKPSSDFNKEQLDKRIANLEGKVATVRVGGITEYQAGERKHLLDDSIAATAAALRGGILPGGATSLLEVSRLLTDQSDGADILRTAFEQPFKQLMSNAGQRSGVKRDELTEFGKGFDISQPEILVDLIENGIIDPTEVIKQAVTNSVSAAGTALTTGTLLVEEPEEDKK